MQNEGGSAGRATFLIVVASLSFGSISVLTLLIMGAGVPLVTAMAWRYVVGAILLSIVAQPWRMRSYPSRKIAQLLLIGGCGQALITYLSLHALEYIPVGPLAFLFYTYPAWVTLIAAVRGSEKLTTTRVVALSLALAGVVVMVGAPAAEKLNPIGVALALGSALLYSAYLPALNAIQSGMPAMLSTFLLVVGAGTTFLLSALLTGKLYLPDTMAPWVNIFLLALVSTVIAFSALIRGLAVLGPVRTAIISTVEPFFTAILGALVIGNPLTVATLFGGILIAAAVLLLQWSSRRREATTSP
ncbi:MAG TPA: DMT family transporter [Gemmatimonadaceae bacterium]|nr:DMT family transporter [Gemmatimonadaceae bacterium]